MAKITNKSQKGYTIIQNTVMTDKSLSLKELGMLCKLIHVAGIPDFEFSVNGFANMLPDGSDAVRSAIKGLEKKGYLRRVQGKKNNKFTNSDWEVADTPIFGFPDDGKPDDGKADDGKADDGKPDDGKPKTSNVYNNSLTNKGIITNSLTINQSNNKGVNERPSQRGELAILMSYDDLQSEIAKDLFELCVEVCDNYDNVRIGKQIIPYGAFQSRIRKLDRDDLERISDEISEYDKPVKNPRNFMLAALYNGAITKNVVQDNFMATYKAGVNKMLSQNEEDRFPDMGW